MLTTRVIPTSGSAHVGAIDVVAEPALAKQLIGTVSQPNTLDRQLTVRENLYFHGRLFGISPAESRPPPTSCSSGSGSRRGQGLGLRALRWDGPAADGRAGDPPPPGRPVPRRADRRPRSQSRLALWEILGELNCEGQTILLTTHYMEEADQLCDRVAIMDHGRILALDTPAALKRSGRRRRDRHGQGARRRAALADGWRGDRGVDRTRVVAAGRAAVRGGERLVSRVVNAAESDGFEVADLSVFEPSLETVFITLTGKELRD